MQDPCSSCSNEVSISRAGTPTKVPLVVWWKKQCPAGPQAMAVWYALNIHKVSHLLHGDDHASLFDTIICIYIYVHTNNIQQLYKIYQIWLPWTHAGGNTESLLAIDNCLSGSRWLWFCTFTSAHFFAELQQVCSCIMMMIHNTNFRKQIAKQMLLRRTGDTFARVRHDMIWTVFVITLCKAHIH